MIPPLSHATAVPEVEATRRRHRRQSQALVIAVGLLLPVGAILRLSHTPGVPVGRLALVSILFGLIAWGLRTATPGAAALGSIICFTLAAPVAGHHGVSPLLLALIVVVVLTAGATRFRRSTKERASLAEKRTGRRASQIAANLGMASLCALAGQPLAALAALAEATADTLASEIGQSLPGRTVMLTTLRLTTPGTDGGISLPGTLAGCVGALLTAIAGARSVRSVMLAGIAAVFGLLVDSLLGATLERRGLLGNDAVNFLSTAASALTVLLVSAV